MIRRIWDVTFTVKDLKKSVEFYEGVLGLNKKYEFRDYVGFDCCGIEIGLKTWGELEPPRKGEPILNFLVDDVEESYRALIRKGVKILEPPKETLWGSKVLLFQDPDGNTLQFTEIYWQKYFKVSSGS